jgi:hypothetical protein
MLRDRDFTYFTKETLFILTEDPKSRDVPAGSMALIPMLLEIFSVVKLLRAFYSLKPGVDMSYCQVIYKRLYEIKRRVLPDDFEDET